MKLQIHVNSPACSAIVTVFLRDDDPDTKIATLTDIDHTVQTNTGPLR